jgi:outer membrane protein, multidrug efflux system
LRGVIGFRQLSDFTIVLSVKPLHVIALELGTDMSRTLCSLAAALLLGACATQPDYRRPTTDLPAEWSNASDHASGMANSEDARHELWWTALRDPAIDALVLAALNDNPTLAQAAARVDQAKAAFAIERAQRLPRIDVTVSSAREQVGLDGNTGGMSTSWQSTAALGPSLSWEIDLWGRIRENTLAAHRRLQARDADARDARLSIGAQVANGVLSLRACNLLLTVRDADIASRENELVIIRTRVRFGTLPPVDVAAAESNLATVRIDRIAEEELCLQTIDALVAVTGRAAHEVRFLVASSVTTDRNDDLAAQLPSAPAIILDLPATVLLAHPTVVAAERELAARWSEIALARAERLPRLDLTAILTGQWIRAFGSTDSFTTGSAGLAISAPLFDGGAGGAAVTRADASYREAMATLDATIRQAVRDIEDGLAAQDSAARRVELSRSALSAARYTLRANEARRRAGSIGSFELEESRRQLNRAQESAIVAARDRAQSWVELVRRTSSIVEVRAATEGSARTFVSRFGMESSQ